MKRMKKRLLGVLLAVLFAFSPVSAFAAEASVSITSGLTMEADTVEYTFEDSRIVYGEAAPNARITFSVSKKDAEGEWQESYRESLQVGSLGLFSATLPLETGYNQITLTARQKGCENTVQETIVKRLPKTVKKQLQSMLALPSGNVK